MRSIAGKWFNANEQQILDWSHIARRFEAIGKGLIYLPHVEDFKYRSRDTGIIWIAQCGKSGMAICRAPASLLIVFTMGSIFT